MNVLEVIPIVKGITKPSLSYFSKKSFNVGSFVKIPLRNGFISGIVIKSENAKLAKSAVRKAGFSLKKISLTKRSASLSNQFIKAAEETANFYCTSVGSILATVVPKIFLESPELIGNGPVKKEVDTKEVRLVQLPDKERFLEYRSIVRECFARRASLLFIVPTRKDATKAALLLGVGIESYVYITTGKTQKKVKQILKEAQVEKHPILLITTPALVSFIREDLDTIILERENSRAYRTLSRPYINIKTFIELYSKYSKFFLIYGDSVLSIQSLWLEKTGRYEESAPLTWRLKHQSETEVIDMRVEKNFNVLSDKLQKVIKTFLDNNQNIFLFGVRKGLSGTTICGDCGSLLLCKNCKSPLALKAGESTTRKLPIYSCNHCGAKRSAETRCDNCQSWKLTQLGIGVEKIAEECAKLFPNAQILLVDKNHTPTDASVKTIIKNYESENPTILVGTELAFNYIDNIPLVAAVSVDSLFSVPDFYINEKIFYLITRLREISSTKFILQTRNAGIEILENAAAGNILDFYRNEIAEREEHKYPPFTLFIKISTEDKREKIEQKAVLLQNIFRNFEPHFTLEVRANTNLHVLSMTFRLDRAHWPNREVGEKLLLLTSDFLIKVDPEGIL